MLSLSRTFKPAVKVADQTGQFSQKFYTGPIQYNDGAWKDIVTDLVLSGNVYEMTKAHFNVQAPAKANQTVIYGFHDHEILLTPDCDPVDGILTAKNILNFPNAFGAALSPLVQLGPGKPY